MLTEQGKEEQFWQDSIEGWLLMKIWIDREVSKIRMNFFMRSTIGEIQRISNKGDLIIWNESQSSRRNRDTQVSRFNES